MCGSALNLLFGVFKLSLLHVFFSFMMVIFGFVTILLEQQQSFVPRHYLGLIEVYFYFLTQVYSTVVHSTVVYSTV